MSVKLANTAEPLSFAARTDSPAHPGGKSSPKPILARSQAANVLDQELSRYCDGTLRGRSFLIAGHRGSGKTTLVDEAILTFQKKATSKEVRFRPLPVYLQGPILIPPPPKPGFRPKGAPTESIEERVLIEVAQGLHQAVAREFVERFHLRAAEALGEGASKAAEPTTPPSTRPKSRRAEKELAELAARFQIELNEAPTAERLRVFWEKAGATDRGILFGDEHNRGTLQGMRELVALNGVTHVYERISGEVKLSTGSGAAESQNAETSSGVDAKFGDFVRPIASLTAGTVVGGSSALAGNPIWAIFLGALTALGAGLLLKSTMSTSRSAKHQIDKTFIPDLKTKTLHRVMPELFERLLAAGLAPVFVVDELDKVDDLYSRIHPLLDNLKKLFAERALTCLLVDRGFYEQLYLREQLERRSTGQVDGSGGQKSSGGDGVRPAFYGRNYSYFSHRIFVTHQPEDLHEYLSRLLYQEGGVKPEVEALDMLVLRWVLLHKSQLNALALNRHIESLRGSDDALRLPDAGTIRSDEDFRTDHTLQFAIEIELPSQRENYMLRERPRLELALLDAAYYISWMRAEFDQAGSKGDKSSNAVIDLSKDGQPKFADYLVRRMNLWEDKNSKPPEDGGIDVSPLSQSEIDWLYGVAISIARTLSSVASADDLKERWVKALGRRWADKRLVASDQKAPDQSVFDALLVQEKSPLIELTIAGKVPEAGERADSFQFVWRKSLAPEPPWSKSIRDTAAEAESAIQTIESIHESLLIAMRGGSVEEGALRLDDDSPLGLLSDKYRVLPTSPAWTIVRASVGTIRQAQLGLGDLHAVHEAQSSLREYAAFLEAPNVMRTVVLAMSLAAMLAGLHKEAEEYPENSGPTLNLWDFGLSLIRDGLNLSDVGITVAEQRITAAIQQSRDLANLPAALATDGALSSAGASWVRAGLLRQLMLQCFSLGSATSDVIRKSFEPAKKSLVLRLRQLVGLGPVGASPHVAELICYAAENGVHRLLPVNLALAGTRTWSKLLIAAMRHSPLEPENLLFEDGDEEFLTTLAAHAVERLGVGGLDTPTRKFVLDALSFDAIRADAVFRKIERVTTRRSAVGTNRVAIVVCSEPSSMAERWPVPPKTCFALAMTDDELRPSKSFKVMFLTNSLDAPLRIALEPECAFSKGLEDSLSSTKHDIVSMYRSSQTPRGGRHVIDPASADYLWTA